ncbi:MAG: carbohydrate ABC transporter permease [Lachnospiraceae bacterium]|nr:carbohydrate ABC transporter permease [Lachnospiraceae bacterium]MCI9202521.1 carbohydrate ABC transporter permease [Lachnospiraceae bacterium]
MRKEREGNWRDHSTITIKILSYTVMGFLCFLVVMPCLNLISEAVSPGRDVMAGKVYFWPTGFQLETIFYVLTKTNFFPAMKNSLVVTGLGTLVSVITTITTAYPLSRPEFKGRKFFTFLYVFSMIFFGGMIPAYMVVKTLGLIDTYGAMILPFAVIQFNMFMVKNYFEGLPNEVIESACADGAGDFRILFSIVCPMAKPVIATVTLLYAVNYWNNYFHAMLYTTSISKQTLQVYLKNLIANIQSTLSEIAGSTTATENLTSQGMTSAAVLMSVIPIVILYPFLARYLVSGITIGSVKG